MRSSKTLVAGLFLVLLFPIGGAAQSGSTQSVTAERVKPFTRLNQLRVKPLADSELTDAQKELLGPGGTNTQVRACLPNLALCRAYWTLVMQNTIKNITIPVRDHELLVLRTAWLNRSNTIWGNHIGCCAEKQAKLTPEEITRITQGPNAPGWNASDRATLQAADELHALRFITEPTWNALKQRFNDGQMFEVVMTVGNYTNVMMYMNTFGIQPGAGEKGIPADFYR